MNSNCILQTSLCDWQTSFKQQRGLCAQFKYYRHLEYLLVDHNYTLPLPDIYSQIPLIYINNKNHKMASTFVMKLQLRKDVRYITHNKVCVQKNSDTRRGSYMLHTLLYLLILSATATVLHRAFLNKLAKLSNK